LSAILALSALPVPFSALAVKLAPASIVATSAEMNWAVRFDIYIPENSSYPLIPNSRQEVG
jgi:hypothetical protein